MPRGIYERTDEIKLLMREKMAANPEWRRKCGSHKGLEDEIIRKSHFAKYGFGCLVIWESELKNPNKIVEKVRNFIG
jgi:hypothetical protein